jgi:ABC-2 type transport system ATP-binding protein
MKVNVLEIQNLSKQIGQKKILNDINLQVKAGEIYGFLGPNGAGKTTTIRIIVGLIKPTTGTVKIHGFDIQKEREKALAKVGAIVEIPEMYDYMSGRKNLIHYARLARINSKDIEKKISEVIKIVDLEHRIDEPVRTYSLGMRQRLGIAQALIGNPSILILDEPSNGLDPNGIIELRNLIKRIADSGVAVFISSHILSEIQLICDRVSVIKAGNVLIEQEVSEFLKEANGFVEIKVDRLFEAKGIISKKGWLVEENKGCLKVQISEEEVPALVKELVKNEINLFYIERVKKSLESKFLELINTSTGEQL